MCCVSCLRILLLRIVGNVGFELVVFITLCTISFLWCIVALALLLLLLVGLLRLGVTRVRWAFTLDGLLLGCLRV